MHPQKEREDGIKARIGIPHSLQDSWEGRNSETGQTDRATYSVHDDFGTSDAHRRREGVKTKRR